MTITNPLWHEITECRLCACKKLDTILDLGDQPPANSLTKSKDNEETKIPLRLLRCAECSTVQLSATVDPAYLFSHYVWVTGTSRTAIEYSKTFSEKVIKYVPKNNPFVLEIASNDGTFLKCFKEKGCKVLGIDPAQNIAEIATNAGIETWPEFFNEEVATKVLSKVGRPDVAIARNVLPHVKQIDSIAKGLCDLVGKDGTIVVEFHYAGPIVDELHYDSIYHEHLFYFSLKTMGSVFQKYGFSIYDLFRSPISGGSLVVFLSSENKPQTSDLEKALLKESDSNLNELETWKSFGEKSKEHADQLRSMIQTRLSDGKCVAYGASARSSTMLNFAEIDCNYLAYVIDKNPWKQGLFTPGTRIPIVGFDEGLQGLSSGDSLILLAWNFEKEIVDEVRRAGFEGQILVPLPERIRVI